MASFLEGLTPDQRLLYPLVRGGVRQGLSIAAIGDIVRDNDFRIANATLREFVRRERAVVDRLENLKFLGRNRLPDLSTLPEALGTLKKAFYIGVEVTGRNINTGETETQTVGISTSKPLTRAEWEEAAASAITDNASKYGIEPDSFRLVDYMKAGPSGVLFVGGRVV